MPSNKEDLELETLTSIKPKKAASEYNLILFNSNKLIDTILSRNKQNGNKHF